MKKVLERSKIFADYIHKILFFYPVQSNLSLLFLTARNIVNLIDQPKDQVFGAEKTSLLKVVHVRIMVIEAFDTALLDHVKVLKLLVRFYDCLPWKLNYFTLHYFKQLQNYFSAYFELKARDAEILKEESKMVQLMRGQSLNDFLLQGWWQLFVKFIFLNLIEILIVSDEH